MADEGRHAAALNALVRVVERRLDPDDWMRLAEWKDALEADRQRTLQLRSYLGHFGRDVGRSAANVLRDMSIGWLVRADLEFQRAGFRWSEEACRLLQRVLEERVQTWSDRLVAETEGLLSSRSSPTEGVTLVLKERDRTLQIIEAEMAARRFAADALASPLLERLRAPRYARVAAAWESSLEHDEYPVEASRHAVNAAEELLSIVSGIESGKFKTMVQSLQARARLPSVAAKAAGALWGWASQNVRHRAKQPEEIDPAMARWAIGQAEVFMHLLLEADVSA